MSKCLKILFGFSLLLNLIVLGAVLGIAMRWHWGSEERFAPKIMRQNAFERLLHDVPATEAHEVLQQNFLSLKQETKANSVIIRKYRDQIRALANRETFDAASYQDSIREILAKKHQTEFAYAVLLGKIMAAMPADERYHALKLLYRGGGKKHHRKHD